MKHKKRFVSIFMAAAILILPVNVFAKSTKTIDIVSINDFHGSLTSSSDTDKNIGAARLVQAVYDRKAKNPFTVTVSAGDNFNGSALSNSLYGEPVAIMLNNLGIVASAIGNHEYDWGTDKFSTWKNTMGAPFLAANIYNTETNKPVDYALPYIIKDIQGTKVAFIGLTTQETAYKTKPENVKGLEFKDPVVTAREYVKIVKEEGADIVILLTHIGTFQDTKTGVITFEEGTEKLASIKNVDGIITGHTHQSVAGTFNNIPVVQGYYNGRSLGVLSFTVDTDTNEILNSSASIDALYTKKSTLTESLKTKLTVDNYTKKVGPLLSEVYCELPNGLSHDKTKLSDLGQWTSEVMQKSADADVAITNGGGLRRSLEPGNVTLGDLYEVMPFDNVLTTLELSGTDLRSAFEHGLYNQNIGMLQYSGVVVTYDASKPEGSRVVSINLEDGTPVTSDKTYKVVTNDFMATGGDGFTMLQNGKLLGEGAAIRDVMVSEFKEKKSIDYKPIERLKDSTQQVKDAA